MPIYEYRCEACDRIFEYQQKMSEDPKKVCESCGGKLEKLISQSSFALKGGGWYSDLYASPKPAAAAAADKKAGDGASPVASKADSSSGSAGSASSTPSADSSSAPKPTVKPKSDS